MTHRRDLPNKENIWPVAKIESEEPTRRSAVLSGADNAKAAVIEGLLAETALFGRQREAHTWQLHKPDEFL